MARLSKRVQKRRKSASPLDDTIEVKQKSSAITISDDSDVPPATINPSETRQPRVSLRNRASRIDIPNRPWARKGKAPVFDPVSVDVPSDVDMDDVEPVHDDDFVEEYEFTSDNGDHEDEYDLDDDVKSVITLSSESSDHNIRPMGGISDRPWKTFDDQTREQWELMYAALTPHAIGGDWEATEDYMREKDLEMLRYLDDYALPKWIIPQEQANTAYLQLLERSRWRALGIKIYRERIAEWPSGGLQAPRAQPNPSIPNGKFLPVGPPSMTPPVQQTPNQPSQQPTPQPPQQRQMSAPSPQQSIPQQHGPYHGLPIPAAPPPPGFLPAPAHHMNYAAHAPIHLPPGMVRPIGLPPHVQYGIPPGYPGFYPPAGMLVPDHTGYRKSRAKKETPPPPTPPPPPPTPPYPVRERPGDRKAASTKPGGRRVIRKAAEAEEFPWCRKLNFPEAKANASWDDSIYDPEIIKAMEATRAHNVPIIDEIDQHIQEAQKDYRISRAAKKKGIVIEKSSDNEKPKERKKKEARMQNTAGGDPYHSGIFCFATPEDEKRANALKRSSPDEVITDAEAGKLDIDDIAKIMITWHPGKKGQAEKLRQAVFSVRDTVLTRKQLEKTPILTQRAAECVLDFCPDMLWRSMLLRITSEAGYGNKDVRDRFCHNGCYCDKATITKRISAALGQKQTAPKAKAWQEDDFEWYDNNVRDFAQYIDYFGKRTSHRNMLKIQIAGEKRRAKAMENAGNGGGGGGGGDHADDSSDEVKVSSARPKRRKVHKDSDMEEDEGDDVNGDDDGEQAEDDDEDDEDQGEDSGEEEEDDGGVSVQDSEILDRMAED